MNKLPIGKAIAYARAAAHLNQEGLGKDRSYISKIETGKHQPCVATYLEIVNAVGARLVIVTKAGEQVEVTQQERTA